VAGRPFVPALGKIILASLRPDQLKRFLERADLKTIDHEVDHRRFGAAARNCRDQNAAGAALELNHSLCVRKITRDTSLSGGKRKQG